jgi:hypothetical protein
VLASLRFDAAVEDGIAERPARYPDGAVFAGANLSRLGEVIARNAREDRAVALKVVRIDADMIAPVLVIS